MTFNPFFFASLLIRYYLDRFLSNSYSKIAFSANSAITNNVAASLSSCPSPILISNDFATYVSIHTVKCLLKTI